MLVLKFGLCWLSIGAFFISGYASAYTLSTSPNGHSIRWRSGQKFYLTGNPEGQEHFSADAFYRLVVSALQQWKLASNDQLDFDYWQGTHIDHFPTGLKQNGQNNIFFASNSNEKTDPNVIGFTQVWYNNSNGAMIESNTMLNDRDYDLTDNPYDTSSSSPHFYGTRPKVFLGNIITHEIGHAIGMSHTGNINSSMLYVEFSEQNRLGCDDLAGVQHLYPSPNGTGSGKLSGSIVSPSGEPIAGAQVSVISKSRGIPIASILTDQSGHFKFGALEAGTIALYVESFKGSPNSVPAKVQSKNLHSICAGANAYPTQFYTEADGHSLKPFLIQNGVQNHAGELRLQCQVLTDSGNQFQTKAASDMVVDLNESGTPKTYYFNANGPFTLTGLGYLLLSSVTPTLSVTDANGKPVEIQSSANLYQSPDSHFNIPDLQIKGTANGLIRVQVTASPLSLQQFPAPAIYPSQIPYYVLVFNASPEAYAKNTPQGPRCLQTIPTTVKTYQSPPGNPTRPESVVGRSEVGFCGNANADSMFSKDRRNPSAPLGSILSWFFPFLVAIASKLYLQAARRRLVSSKRGVVI